jgi:hypothetical protein
MTTGPNNLIQSFGETVTHIKIEVTTQYGEEQSRTETSQEIQAIVSSPTEEDAQQLEGRVDSSTYKLTVPSSVDVAIFRDGGDTQTHYDRDEFIVRGVRCEVASGGISDDTHPITGTEKQTVLVQAKE